MDYITLNISNSCDLANIMYQDGWQQRLYLIGEIARPEYVVEVESNKDGENNDIPEFQKWIKRYKIKAVVNEPLADALTLAMIHDTISVTSKLGDTAQVKVGSFICQIDWRTDCWAEANIQFDVDYVVKDTCCDNLITECLSDTAQEAVMGYLIETDPKFTDPLENGVQNGDRYLINIDGNISIYYYDLPSGVWVIANPVGSGYVINSETGQSYWFDGATWILSPNVIDVTFVGNTEGGSNWFQVDFFGIPNSFVQFWYKCFNEEEYQAYPVVVDAGSGSYLVPIDELEIDEGCPAVDFYITNFTNNCDYGISNSVTGEIPPE